MYVAQLEALYLVNFKIHMSFKLTNNRSIRVVSVCITSQGYVFTCYTGCLKNAALKL
jgi:hypothetical protein